MERAKIYPDNIIVDILDNLNMGVPNPREYVFTVDRDDFKYCARKFPQALHKLVDDSNILFQIVHHFNDDNSVEHNRE